MKTQNTIAIILNRVNYAEADRILTLLTPDHGKLKLIARGVRKEKSKLAGGIELFCISNITFIMGRSEIGTLISTRLVKYYKNITHDFDRTLLGYELIKQLNRATEDKTEPLYFELLNNGFEALNDLSIDSQLIQWWFSVQLLRYAGHTPSLALDANSRLDKNKYSFNFDKMSFVQNENGPYSLNHIKLLKVGFSDNLPSNLQRISDIKQWLPDLSPLIQTMIRTYIRL